MRARRKASGANLGAGGVVRWRFWLHVVLLAAQVAVQEKG